MTPGTGILRVPPPILGYPLIQAAGQVLYILPHLPCGWAQSQHKSQTEEKAKVVAAVSGTYLNAAPAI